jgi:hypothetical protein
MKLKKDTEFPIRTYQKLESDSMNAILSALGKLGNDGSASVQLLLRPVDDDWQEGIKKKIRKAEKHSSHGFHISLNPLSWIRGLIEVLVRDPEDSLKHEPQEQDEHEEPMDEE